MTTRFPSFGSFRALAASRRRGHLAGGSWSAFTDRDLDRVSADLLAVAHADPERLAPGWAVATQRVSEPVDLAGRRARGLRPDASGPAPHARAS